jgi:nucleoside 2-deoxyribosyltransferase
LARLYFAAPLFSEAERAFNEELTARIEALGYDVFLPQRDGRVPDEGVALELGLAYADRERRGVDRRIIGLMTDWRSAFANEPLNAMLFGALDEVHTTVDGALSRLAELA